MRVKHFNKTDIRQFLQGCDREKYAQSLRDINNGSVGYTTIQGVRHINDIEAFDDTGKILILPACEAIYEFQWWLVN